ncbi:MAG: YdeI/OmpD-associated family protein [Parasphingopyxis sp.]|uniref:YdeI/OmpD-associated family protein n=1 Tax=Parasphingopyxis sp. TaxID=1920299 RepID=UPI003F9FB181
MTRDKRIDTHIEERTAAFAQPILRHIRETVHGVDEGIEEGIKWGVPAFLYDGRTLAIMASFKRHAVLSFSRDKEFDLDGLGLEDKAGEAMGRLGRIESMDDLPPDDAIVALTRQAIALEKAGPPRKATRPAIEVPPLPEPFAEALAADTKARTVFDGFPPGAQRDYVEWIAGAKREATRDKRIATAIEWLAEGKKRNWKYEKC